MRRPAQSVGLMELGNAFQEFVPELRTMLRDVAAREDNDARAKGEQEAEALYRQGRLADINATLKAKADSGEIPRHLVPSYREGASYRFGAHAADALNADLLKTVNEAAAKGNAEDHIQAALQAAAAKVNQSDTFARAGFDQAAQQVVNGYRQRVAMQAATNYEQQAEYEAAQVGYRAVSELATAPEDQVSSVLQRVKAGLDLRRDQISPTAVNAEFLKNSVGPAVADLFAQQRFDEAHQLISRLRSFDVTGQGGMFGKISDVSYQLDVLEREAINRGEQHAQTINERLKRDLETAQLAAGNFVTDTLESAKQGGQPFLPSDIDAAVSAWAKNLPASIDKPAYTRAARERFARELSEETAQRRALHAAEVGAFMSKMTSLKPEDIDRYEAYAGAVEAHDFATPDDLKEMRNRISTLRARTGIVTDSDSGIVMKNVFPVYSLFAGQAPAPHPTFSPSVPGASEAWDELDQDARGDLQLATKTWAVDRLRELTGTFNDMKQADAEMPKLRDRVVQEAQTKAAQDAVRMAKALKARDAHHRARELATRMKLFDAGALNAKFHPEYESETKDAAGKVVGIGRQSYPLPGVLPNDPSYKTVGVVPAERNAATIMTPGWTRRGDEVWVDLPAVAKDVNQSDDPAKARKALELYGVAKARLGFTPDEVMNGVTKHGVAFTAKEIDPRFIPVFRSVAELEEAWNDGAPSPLFRNLQVAVSDVDPRNPMRASDFYSAQMALLKRSR